MAFTEPPDAQRLGLKSVEGTQSRHNHEKLYDLTEGKANKFECLCIVKMH